MDCKKWLMSQPLWLRYGIIVSALYSLLLIFLYTATFIPFPNLINFLLDKIHETFYLPQIYLSSKILIRTLIYDNYRSFNILFYLLQLVFTIIVGFIIGAVIGKIKSKE